MSELWNLSNVSENMKYLITQSENKIPFLLLSMIYHLPVTQLLLL